MTSLLLDCLRAAVSEPELVRDLAETCKASFITLEVLAAVKPEDVEDIAQLLYLTPEEATRLVHAAKSATEGVSPSPMAAERSLSKIEEDGVSGQVAAKPAQPRAVRKARPSSTPLSKARTQPAKSVHVTMSPPAFASPSHASSGTVSRLMAPTATFLSRVMGQRAESKAGRNAAEAAMHMRLSQKLDSVMASPQGQRTTKPVTFSLATDTRPRNEAMSTDEAAMQEAKKHMFKPHVVPKGLREPVPLDGFARNHSAPQDPAALFKPFSLSSLGKHEQYQKAHAERLAAEQAEKEASRVFKAQQLDKGMLEQVASPRKPAAQPVTQGVAPTFASEARVAYHRDVLEPARRAKMSQADREKLEAAERAVAAASAAEAAAAAERAAAKAREAEMETMDVATLRKSMVFKARALPDFSSPFKPDPTKSLAVTQSLDFNFKTSQRLGSPVAHMERQDSASPAVGRAGFANYLRSSMGPASLRSPGQSMSPSTSHGNPTVALRRSLAVTSSAPTTPSAMLRASLKLGATRKASTSLAAQLSSALDTALESVASGSAPGTPRTCASTSASRRTTADVGLDSPVAVRV